MKGRSDWRKVYPVYALDTICINQNRHGIGTKSRYASCDHFLISIGGEKIFQKNCDGSAYEDKYDKFGCPSF